MRRGFSVRWRTVIFVKMLTGFSLLSSYRFSLARFLIAWPLFSLVSTDRAAWHRLIYTIQLLFWDRMVVKNCFSGQHWTRWSRFSLKRLHVCTVPVSLLSSGIYRLTIFFSLLRSQKNPTVPPEQRIQNLKVSDCKFPIQPLFYTVNSLNLA